MSLPTAKVFKWSRKSEWRKTFFDLMDDFADEQVLVETQKFEKARFSIEDISWLNEIISRIKGPQTDVQIRLAERLQKYYDFAIAFHGCRPSSVESYKKQGLRPSDTNELRRIATELFGDTPRLHESFQELQNGYGGYESHNNGKIFFSLIKHTLLNEWNGYLLNGSEFLAAIANRLNVTDKLIGYGKPVIVECLISREQLDFSFWKSIAAHEIEDVLNKILFPNAECKRRVSTGFYISSAIPPERLKFHFPNELVVQTEYFDFDTNQIHRVMERKLCFNQKVAA
ncbi:MAG: hypothetical protein ABSC89_03155 [Verrucomicrobiota bacterium]|jgi:hypothetical protein